MVTWKIFSEDCRHKVSNRFSIPLRNVYQILASILQCLKIIILVRKQEFKHTQVSSETSSRYANSRFLSHHLSLLAIPFGKSYRQQPVSALSWWIYIFAGQQTLVCPYVGVHRRISFEFILTSSAVPSMSCSPVLDSLQDGR